jgi:uncharacterized protein (TIGR02246 family)
MPKRKRYLLAGGLLALLAGSFLAGGGSHLAKLSAKPTAETEDQGRQLDHQGIHKLTREFVKAFDKGDAKAIASLCTEQCEYYDDTTGEVFLGRAAIEQAYADLFKERPGSKIEVNLEYVRFLSRDSAVEEGSQRLRAMGTELPLATRYSGLCVREDGQWRVALIHEWGGDKDKLEDIDWLVGDWVAKSPEGEVEMRFHWNDKKTMILNQFARKESGQLIASGIQHIALDPQTGQLRSWAFDEAGGHGQSLWYRDGNQWILESLGVLSDGQETASLNIITRAGDDAFTWRSIERTIAGEQLPDTDPVKLVKVKAAK